MGKEEKIKIEELLSNIDKEFPKVSLKNISAVEDFIKNEELNEKVMKELSFFLLDYDKKSIENNTKYGFPESDFEDYKNRDLFIARIYKQLVLRYEKDNKDTEKIREFLKLGGQKIHDRKNPYRCLKLGRLDYDDSFDDFKELSHFYTDRIKRYGKNFKFIESENTKAYNDFKKTKQANIIKLILVIVIVLGGFFIGKQASSWVSGFFNKEEPKNQTENVANEIKK